jgi:hypothetical protein
MTEKRSAVIVGIDKYPESSGFPPLHGAGNDARDMHKRLTEFGEFEARLLLNEGAKHTVIREAISDLLWQTDNRNDLSLFYFSGHGIVDGYDNGYIAPYDMVANKPFVAGITHHDLRQALSQSQSRAGIIILDSCYSGGAAKGQATPDVKKAYETFEQVKSLKTQATGEGKFIFASTDDYTVSKEKYPCRHGTNGDEGEHYHGAFTFRLLEGLDGSAKDKRGVITLGELVRYVQEKFVDEKQKPIDWCSRGFLLENVRIAYAPKERTRYIQELIKGADEYDRTEPSELFEAVGMIHEALDLRPHDKDALDRKEKINQILRKWKEQTDKWLTLNKRKLITTARRKWRFTFPHDRLAGLIPSLDFDAITQLSEVDGDLLADLCEASIKDRIESFVKACSFRVSQSSQPKKPKTLHGPGK